MDIILIIISGIFLLAGLAGSVLPVLPGVPLSYLGLLILSFSKSYHFSALFLISWGIVTVTVLILDNILPLVLTQKMGGSKLGLRASTIGMFVGLLYGPVGMVVGTFLGALIGEILSGKKIRRALLPAFGSFLGFLIGTVTQLIISLVMIYYYIAAIIHYNN